MSMDDSELVGGLCSRRPMALPVLHRHGIDAGDVNRTLAEACRAHGISPTELGSELAAEEARVAQDWRVGALDELLDHLVRGYHRAFEAEVTTVSAALDAARPPLEDVRRPIWKELRRQVDELHADMTQHMEKEEHVLFPWLRSHARTAGGPIRAMQLEHADTILLLLAIHATARQWAAAGPRGPLDEAVVSHLEHLERRLCEHIHVESNTLFPRALGP